MKLYQVICELEWEGSCTVKVFASKAKANAFASDLQDKEDKKEYPSYHYYVSEIEADLDE